MRKLVWTALATAVAATCAGAAVRALDWAWRRATKRPPPAMPRWAGFLLGNLLSKQIARRGDPPVA